MKSSRFLIPAMALVGLLVTGTANAGDVVMDFQDLEINDGGIHNWGYLYTAGDWMISHPNNEPFEFATFGTQEARYPGSTALFNNTVGGVMTFERIDGAAFDMQSIDIANLNNNGPVTVNFVGNLADGNQVFDSYTTTGVPNVLETYFFDAHFTGLSSLVWTQEGPFHQFDNISVIPAPGGLALLGLVALGARRRRRA